MLSENPNYQLSRLLSGKTLCRIDGQLLYVKKPKQDDLLYIYAKCDDLLRRELDLLTDNEIFQYMVDCEYWTLEEQNELDRLPDSINALKIDLYNAYIKYKNRDAIKRKITSLNDRLNKLYNKRYIYEDITAQGYRNFVQSSYIIGFGTHRQDGSRFWTGDDFLYDDFNVLTDITREYTSQVLNDVKIRKMARNPKWKSYWSISKNPLDIFQVNSLAELNDEQRNLTSWTQLYDNIYGSPDVPPTAVIDDDDMLDGWLLVQEKKRKQEERDREGQLIANGKGGHQDVFVIVENEEDLSRVNSLNDNQAQLIKREAQKKWKAQT